MDHDYANEEAHVDYARELEYQRKGKPSILNGRTKKMG